MNRTKKLLIACVTIGALAGISLGGGAFASQKDQTAATIAMQEYVAAYKDYDVSALSKYVKDTRYSNEDELQAANAEHLEADKNVHRKLKLISVDKVSGGFTGTFEMSSDDNDPVQFTLPLVEEDGNWKLLIDGSLIIDTKKK